MHHAKDQYILILDAIDNDVFAHRKAARTDAEGIGPGTPKVGVACEKHEAVSYGIDQLVGGIDTAAFLDDVIPNTIKVSYCPGERRDAPLATRLFCGEASLAALFDFLGKFPHGLLRDDAPLAAC
jgi:hypothetical protein